MMMSVWDCLKMYALHTPSLGGKSRRAGRTSLSSGRFGIRRSGSSVWCHQPWGFGRHICYFHQESWVQFTSGWHKIYVMIYRVLMLWKILCLSLYWVHVWNCKEATWYSHSFLISFSYFNSDCSIQISRVWQHWQLFRPLYNIDKGATAHLLR